MDLFSSVISMVRDYSEKDRQFKNLSFQITYTLQKANHLLKKVQQKSSGIDFMIKNLERRIGDAVQIQQKLLRLLNAQNIGMKDKIRLSLPFDQTKNTATTTLENLEKAINDLKDFVQQQPKEQEIIAVKRKVSESSVQGVNARPPQKTTNQQVDEGIQQIYEMGPTIQQNQVNFSQMKSKKQVFADINITIMGMQQIIGILQKQEPDLVNTKKKIKLEEKSIQETVFTVARLNFKKVYQRIKQVTNDIDRISKDAHFHIVCKKQQEVVDKEKGQEEQVKSQQPSTKKNKSQVSQEEEQDVFFSFPQQNISNIANSSKIIMKKDNQKKTVYRFQCAQWEKIESNEIEVLNGDMLAAFINPNSQEPSIYFKVTYGFQ